MLQPFPVKPKYFDVCNWYFILVVTILRRFRTSCSVTDLTKVILFSSSLSSSWAQFPISFPYNPFFVGVLNKYVKYVVLFRLWKMPSFVSWNKFYWMFSVVCNFIPCVCVMNTFEFWPWATVIILYILCGYIQIFWNLSWVVKSC